MSEPMPEQQPGGGFMSRKFLGIPAIVWLLGAVFLAYLYFRNSNKASGASGMSSAGSGTSTTGNVQVTPGPGQTINVNTQYGPKAGGPPRHRTPNPQPHPKHKPPVVKHHAAAVITHHAK